MTPKGILFQIMEDLVSFYGTKINLNLSLKVFKIRNSKFTKFHNQLLCGTITSTTCLQKLNNVMNSVLKIVFSESRNEVYRITPKSLYDWAVFQINALFDFAIDCNVRVGSREKRTQVWASGVVTLYSVYI